MKRIYESLGGGLRRDGFGSGRAVGCKNASSQDGMEGGGLGNRGQVLKILKAKFG